MQGVAREEEAFCEGGGPAGADEFQVAVRRGPVDFVADDRVAGVGEVDPDLVGAAGERFGGDQGEPAFRALDPRQDAEAGVGGGS